MKKVVFLLLVLSLVSFAKPVKHSSQKKQSTVEAVEPAQTETVTESASKNETPANASETNGNAENESLVDSTFTLYIHPMNFIAPYSHFWGGFNVPNGVTDYPSLNLTFEWKLFEKSSLITMPHYVRVDRSDDGYKIYDIGLQESYRWYGVGGRWRYLEVGFLLSHLHVKSDKDGRFDGWLYGFMINGGVKKILNGGEGFLGKFALSVDVGVGYAGTSDFEAERDRAYFKMDKGFVIDVNCALGFQI